MTEDVDAFTAMFKSGFGDHEQQTQTRVKRERRASLSKEQRKRTGRVRDKQVNFRTSAEIKTLIESLVKKTDMTLSEVIEAAVEIFAKSKGK